MLTRKKAEWREFEKYVEKMLKKMHPECNCWVQKTSLKTGKRVDYYCLCDKERK